LNCFSFTLFSPRFADWLAVGCEIPRQLESSKVLMPTNSGLLSSLTPSSTFFYKRCAEPVYKGVSIGIVPKDFSALDDVVKRTRSINSGFSWHTKYK